MRELLHRKTSEQSLPEIQKWIVLYFSSIPNYLSFQACNCTVINWSLNNWQNNIEIILQLNHNSTFTLILLLYRVYMQQLLAHDPNPIIIIDFIIGLVVEMKRCWEEAEIKRNEMNCWDNCSASELLHSYCSLFFYSTFSAELSSRLIRIIVYLLKVYRQISAAANTLIHH